MRFSNIQELPAAWVTTSYIVSSGIPARAASAIASAATAMYPGQQLMDDFYRRAKTNVAPDAVDFAGHGVQHRREAGKGGIAPGGHHRRMSPAAASRRRPIPARRASIAGTPPAPRQWPEHRRRRWWTTPSRRCPASDGRRGRSRRTGSPHLGGIDHQQHNCIQFRGERHRAGARAFGARRQQCATVVGIDVNAPVCSGPPAGRRGRRPCRIEPSPITQTLVCAAMLVSL